MLLSTISMQFLMFTAISLRQTGAGDGELDFEQF
jgi:hypothetical protein